MSINFRDYKLMFWIAAGKKKTEIYTKLEGKNYPKDTTLRLKTQPQNIWDKNEQSRWDIAFPLGGYHPVG